MQANWAKWAMVGMSVLFVLYLVVKSQLRLPGLTGASKELRARLRDAVARAGEGESSEARAQGWMAASRIAAEDLRRPRLAAKYALRALAESPEDPRIVDALVSGLRGMARRRTLERALWTVLAKAKGAAHGAACSALIELYAGAPGLEDRAEALRRMLDQSAKMSSR